MHLNIDLESFRVSFDSRFWKLQEDELTLAHSSLLSPFWGLRSTTYIVALPSPQVDTCGAHPVYRSISFDKADGWGLETPKYGWDGPNHRPKRDDMDP